MNSELEKDFIYCFVIKEKTALDRVLGNGMAAIIPLDTIAVIETEQCNGTPYRYLLYHK